MSSQKRSPLVVGTWHFSRQGVNCAGKLMSQQKASRLEALEAGISVIEDKKTVSNVGAYSIPNCEGELELDAAVMDGPSHESGSVMALKGVKNPIQVARKVLENSPHAQLVGHGAQVFAKKQGFKIFSKLPIAAKRNLSHEQTFKWKPATNQHTDTVAMITIDQKGNLAGGTSTSGYPYSLPGRVGDSPIIGSGLYVDQRFGAAGASGQGEEILKFCFSFNIVMNMKLGFTPQKAVEMALDDYRQIRGKDFKAEIALLAVDTRGRVGAVMYGGSKRKKMAYCVYKNNTINTYYAKRVYPLKTRLKL